MWAFPGMTIHMSKPSKQFIAHLPVSRWLLLVTAFVLCAAALAFTTTGKPAVLSVYPLLSTPGSSLRLAIAPCTKKACKIFVQLAEGEKVVSEMPLAWDAHSQVYSEDMVGRWYGAGDPLEHKEQWKAWTIGESEHDFVVVVAQPLTLAKGIQGLAIHQVTGSEHTRRQHAVYFVKNRKLVLAWQKTEGSGPVWSTLVDAADSKNVSELTYIEALKTGNETTPDRLDIYSLGWNPSTEKLDTKTSSSNSLHYITVYPFDNIATARAFENDNAKCLGSDYMLLSKAGVTNKALPAKFSYIAVTHQKPLAEQARSNLVACLPAKSNIKIDIF